MLTPVLATSPTRGASSILPRELLPPPGMAAPGLAPATGQVYTLWFRPISSQSCSEEATRVYNVQSVCRRSSGWMYGCIMEEEEGCPTLFCVRESRGGTIHLVA